MALETQIEYSEETENIVKKMEGLGLKLNFVFHSARLVERTGYAMAQHESTVTGVSIFSAQHDPKQIYFQSIDDAEQGRVDNFWPMKADEKDQGWAKKGSIGFGYTVQASAFNLLGNFQHAAHNRAVVIDDKKPGCIVIKAEGDSADKEDTYGVYTWALECSDALAKKDVAFPKKIGNIVTPKGKEQGVFKPVAP